MIRSGEYLLLYWGGIAVAAQLTHEFNPETAERNISTKQSGKFEKSRPQRKSGTVNLNILLDTEATLGYRQLFNDWKSGSIKPIKLSPEIIGAYELRGQGYITSPPLSAPDQENVESNVTFKLTGDISYEAITDNTNNFFPYTFPYQLS